MTGFLSKKFLLKFIINKWKWYYTENDEPQPQFDEAFGLETLK